MDTRVLSGRSGRKFSVRISGRERASKLFGSEPEAWACAQALAKGKGGEAFRVDPNTGRIVERRDFRAGR